jgi:uncharacterized membrane protein
MSIEHVVPKPLPATIPQYLEQLRAALVGADPAMIQDALYDAEEYLRSELAEQAGKSEAEVIAGVASSYGAPEEVAEIYRETEVTVNRALRTPPLLRGAANARPVPSEATLGAAPPVGATPPVPPPAPPRSLLQNVFGVVLDPRAYGSLFYMLLSLVTGTFFFTWVVTGLSVSIGMLILIIGVPLLLLFLGSVRVLSLVEGRLVEALLGVRMPRRPTYVERDQPMLQRIGAMFTDARTWSTMLYFLLMLPLGIVYFTIASALLSTSVGLVFSPLVSLFSGNDVGVWINGSNYADSVLMWPILSLVGAALLLLTLHLARGIGKLHGGLAKHLLVRL